MKRLLQLHVSGRVHLEFLVNQSEKSFFDIMLAAFGGLSRADQEYTRVRSRPPPRARALIHTRTRTMLCAAALVSVAWRPSMVTPTARHLPTRGMCARMEQDDLAWAQVTSRPR